MKTLKFNISIGENDFYRKIEQAIKFLEKKEQVKIIVNLRGREKYHADRGLHLLNKAHAILNVHGTRTSKPTERNLSIVYNPRKT